jgi:hypothetical protein
VEITENALIGESDNARRTIQSLKNQGIAIALDDFGTGYSSLQHLRMLPFDKIKIDRSFVLSLDSDPEALNFVRAIVGLASTLGMPTVAEGEPAPRARLHLRPGLSFRPSDVGRAGRPFAGRAIGQDPPDRPPIGRARPMRRVLRLVCEPGQRSQPHSVIVILAKARISLP